MEAEICEIYGPPPTFIKSILQSDDPLTLVYQKPKKLSDSDETACLDSTLDLTGNPLVVDLKYDLNLSILPKSQNWTETELSYFPLNLNCARKVINDFINRKDKCDSNSAIYCICDASDKKKTVILGSSISMKDETRQFIRTVITIVGCLAENDTKMSLEYMKSEHQQPVGENNLKFSSIVTNRYALYGNNLRNYCITDDTEFNSSIHVDVSWSDFQYVLPAYVKSLGMTLQCIVGHKDSKLYPFWKELLTLNNYIMILDKNLEDIEKIFISEDPEPYTKIIEKLCEILNITLIQKLIPKFDMSQTDLNMQDLREWDLLDKLWAVLTRSHRVQDLKICLHTFFEELAHKRTYITLPAQNRSLISRIVGKISAGEIAVPSLTPKQTVECLIELGIEKLKNDYLYIWNHFDLTATERIHSFWNEISERNGDESFEYRHRLPLSHLHLFDLSEIQKKFNFLIHMHTTLEFVLLAKQFIGVPQEQFVYIINCIVKQYLNFDDFIQLQFISPTCQLHEVKISLDSTNTTFLQGLKPISRNFKMTTDNKSCGITTIFHQSRESIFPTTIYDSYAKADENITFFVAKSAMYSNEI